MRLQEAPQEPEEPKFQAFVGSGRRLDGRPVPAKAQPDPSPGQASGGRRRLTSASYVQHSGQLSDHEIQIKHAPSNSLGSMSGPELSQNSRADPRSPSNAIANEGLIL